MLLVFTLLLQCAAPALAAVQPTGAETGYESEALTPETGTPEAGTPETGTPEAGTPETGTPEAGTPETGTTETIPATEVIEPKAAAPAVPTVESGYAQVKLTWEDVEGTTGYSIYRGETEEDISNTALATAVTATAYTDATAATGTQYWYRVDATTADGTVTGTPVQADTATGLEALKQNGTVVYEFDGAGRIFDGTRVVDKTADLPEIQNLTKGSVVVKFRYDGTKSSTKFDALLGIGNGLGAGVAGGKNHFVFGGSVDSGSFALRYDIATIFSSALKTSPTIDDDKWHTAVMTHDTNLIFSLFDGLGIEKGNGYYTNQKNGFLSLIGNAATTMTIGGFSSPNVNTSKEFTNWVGEIAYVIITDEVLPLDKANALTQAEKSDVKVTLAEKETAPTAGATVGTLTLTDGDALSLPAGVGDNGKFTIDGTTLKVGGADLTAGQKYHVFVSGGAGEPFGFTITAKHKDVTIALSGDKTCDLAVGSEVGVLTLGGADAVNATPSLLNKAEDNDNDKFKIVLEDTDYTLKVKTALTAWQPYTVAVTSGVVGAPDASFTITARGDANAPIISIAEKIQLPGEGYPDFTAKTDAVKNLTDMTVTAQFMQTAGGIGSLFSVGNGTSGNKNRHFHLYANGGTLGLELRNDAAMNIGFTASGMRSMGLNTVAFVANSTDKTFKLFINGNLAGTHTFEGSYKFLTDITGIDNVYVGSTKREGSLAYGFTGALLDMKVYPKAMTDQEMLTYTADTAAPGNPAIPDLVDPASTQPFYVGDGTGSTYFRIPALYTLNNGDIMAAIDARFAGAGDSPANLDTAVNFKRSNSTTWETARIPNHFIDFKDGTGGGSASFIDPSILQIPAEASKHANRIYMLVDAYPYGTGINTETAQAVNGMIKIDGVSYLALTKGTRTTWGTGFDFYLKPNPTPNPAGSNKYIVCNKSDNSATEYTTDGLFNLFQNGTALTVKQKNAENVDVPMNIFYELSTFKLFPTSYLYLVHSDDLGATWSDPSIIGNEHRTAANGNFLGVGPGKGHVIQTGQYKGRLLFCVYDEGQNDSGTGNRDERASVLYSDDGGETWKLSARTKMASSNSPGKSSEAQIVELPDGTLRMFARGNAGNIGYTDSFDGGVSWEPMVQDHGLPYVGNCQISVINYSGLIDGKPALILSAPEGGGRNNGIIRVGLINENPGQTDMDKYTIDWKYRQYIQSGRFLYSCLTELPTSSDGEIGILYEHDVDSNVLGQNPNYRTYNIADLTAPTNAIADTLTITGTPVAGGAITVTLNLIDPVLEEFSTVNNSHLTLTGPASTDLAHQSISDDKRVITYTGILPEGNYHYRVSIPAVFPVVTLNGQVTPGKTFAATGVAGSPTFDLTAETPANGALFLSKTSAAVGKIITVTATPNEGYKLVGAPKVLSGSRPIAVTKTDDTHFTFVMPEAPVTVRAAFMTDAAVTGTAKAGYARVKVEWTAEPNLTYSLYRAETRDGLTAAAPLASGLTTGVYLDTAVAANIIYWYRVDTVVSGETTSGNPFSADMKIGIAALKQNAIVSYSFTGEERAFDGNRVVDKTADLNKIKDLTAGTILMQMRYTGTDAADTYPAVFTVGGGSTAEKGVGFLANNGNTIRYNLGDGMHANTTVASLNDGQWHTAALVSDAKGTFPTLDGTADTAFANNVGLGGFLARISKVAEPTAFTIGGRAATGNYLPALRAWTGDIAYLLISDEVLTEAQAQTLTRVEQEAFPKFLLRGSAVTEGVANAAVGEISVVGNGTEATTPALAATSAENSNDMFAIQGGKLVATTALASGQTYTVEVTGTAASGVFSTKFNVRALKGEWPFYKGDASGSNNFRIPALLTLQNGDIMAAIDARLGGGLDSANNLDTAVNFKRVGSNHWGLAALANNFQDFPNSNSGRQLDSTSFIDPAIVQDTKGGNEGRIYMLVDAFPYNCGIQGGICQEGTGMVKVDGKSYLALTTGDRTVGLNTFGYYLKPNPTGGATEQYQVLAVADNAPTGCTTDDHFNLYRNGKAMTILQGATGEPVAMNVFFKGATYQVFPTSYLWLIHSEDNGKTWSAPQLIGNDQRKMGDGKFLGVGPGRGHEVQTGTYAGRILFPLYDHGGNMGERARVVYTDDGVNWTLGGQTTMASANSPGKSSEAQVVELPDGTLRMYARSGANCIGYTDSTNGGATWAPMVQDLGLPYGGESNGCMISVINYSTLIDGKPALVLASPYIPGGGTPNRVNGSIRIGLIEEHSGVEGMGKYTVDWKYRYNINGPEGPDGPNTAEEAYAYSCITELPDGGIAVMYEGKGGRNVSDEANPYKTYTLDELTKGGLRSLTAPGTAAPGTTLTAKLQLTRPVNVTASTLTGGLAITYPGAQLSAGVLTYQGISEDKLTLTFSGALPASGSDYSYKVSIPTGLVIMAEGGVRLQFPGGGTVEGLVSATPPPDTQAPTAPTALTAGTVTATGATITWTASTDNVAVTGYKIYLGEELKATATDTSYDFTGLTAETAYTAKVIAVDGAGNKSAATTTTFTTASPPDTTPPTAPTNLAAGKVTATGATITWTASTDNVAVTGYEVYLGDELKDTVAKPGYTLTGLTAATEYTVKVIAIDGAGNKSAATTTTFTTASPPDTTPPTAPTALAAGKVTATGATITWTASTDNVAVTGYKVYLGEELKDTVTATTYAFTGLTADTEYIVKVVAVDAAGNASAAATATFTTLAATDTQPPTAPTALTAGNVTAEGARLTWTASTDNVAVTGYKVSLDGALKTTVTKPGYTLTGLTDGTAYTAKVIAVDAAGNESAPASVSFTTVGKKTISGVVSDHSSAHKSGAGVSLMLGNQEIAKATTDSDGRYSLKALAGTYMLVVKAGEKLTVTQMVTLDGDKTLDVTLPNGNLSNTVTVAADVPPVLVDGLDGLFTEEDKTAVGNPANSISYDLDVVPAANADEIADITAAAQGKILAALLDIALSKTVNAGTATPITQTGSNLTIIIPLEAAWQGMDYTIYRYHDNRVDAITQTQNAAGEYFRVVGTHLELYVRNFSTYAMAYTQRPPVVVGGSTAAEPKYTVSTAVEGKGTITPDQKTITRGDSAVFTLKPEAGYILDRLLLDGVPVAVFGPDASGACVYALENIRANHALKAVFIRAEEVFEAFTDLSGHWAKENIRYVTELGLMKGVSKNRFEPDGNTSRAMVTTILYRMAGMPAIDEGFPFVDVPKDTWYTEAVAWATAMDLAGGTGTGTFAPTRDITRQELAVLLYNYAVLVGGADRGDGAGLDRHEDSGDVAPWAREAMAWCTEHGVITNDLLRPEFSATRGELATMLQRFDSFLKRPE